MSYTRRNTTDGVTIMNKDLYDNLQDGLEERGVTPEMFGAVGDGVTDDSSHFLQMFLNNSVIFLSYGKTYVLSSPIPLRDNLKIIGNHSTIIFKNCHGFTIDSTEYLYNTMLVDLNIRGDSGFNAFEGTQWLRSSYLKNVRITGFSKIFNGNTFLTTQIVKCTFTPSQSIGELNFHDSYILGCLFQCQFPFSEGGNTFTLSGGLFTLEKCFFNGNASEGTPTFLKLFNCFGISLVGNNFDYNDGYGVEINSCTGVSIYSCTFRGNGRVSNAYIYSYKSDFMVDSCSFLLPHYEGFTYNPTAYIVRVESSLDTGVVFLNNTYQVSLLYYVDKKSNNVISFVEGKLFRQDILPFTKEFNGTLRGETIYATKRGFMIKGQTTNPSTIFILGTWNSTDTIFTLSKGTYYCHTGVKNVSLQIRTTNGSYTYEDCSKFTITEDLNVLSVAMVYPIASYNAEVTPALYKIS